MGKHNGKARRNGLPVGKTLENAARNAKHRDVGERVPNEQSVLESDHVDEIMTLAELAGRDFAADRQKVVVLDSKHTYMSREAERQNWKQVQEEYKQVVRIPRRPPWSPRQTAEELDRREKEYFLNWRRQLALLHEREPDLLLTPYEKNLEVWRQLWRVVERSSVLVQVVDARDPLLYYSEDLQSYATELNADARSLILLNKSDLVETSTRQIWADYFDSRGILYAFWSAKCAPELPMETASEAVCSRVKIHDATGVIDLLDSLAPPIPEEQERESEPTESQTRRVVGLVGYPNVGKSSTINALYGKKKTPVAPTPGRTKHFQTLNISDKLCLCDCPGLVLPAIAKSKAEMVAAGVIPVDRLVDIVSPVRVILDKIGLQQFCRDYGILCSQKKSGRVDEQTAVEAMAALAVARGWTQAAGRPDQTRAGRMIIKDFIAGTLLHCQLPPGYDSKHDVPEADECDGAVEEVSVEEVVEGMPLDVHDIDVAAENLSEGVDTRKPRRAEHKFQKKPPRRKGSRGRQYNQDDPMTSAAFVKGNRGTLTNGLLSNGH